VSFIVQDLVNRARTYIDDDHDEEPGWLDSDQWLAIANAEYAVLFPKLVRYGLITPQTEDQTFTGPITSVGAVIAIVGVAEVLGSGRYRVIEPLQSAYGRAPFFDTVTSSPAVGWTAYGASNDLAVSLYPASTGNYVVRYIPFPDVATSLDDEVDVPYGADERLVLGIARRAKLKESAASAMLERLIMEKDADIAFQSHGLLSGDGPRARPNQVRRRGVWPMNPSRYRYV
jgi:hypothetical protein